MRHLRLRLFRVWIEGAELPLRVADLVIVAHPGAPELDWELVCATSSEVVLERGVYTLEGEGHDGRRLRGQALLVRSDGAGHVFRGGGPLDGVDPDELR